MQFKFYKYQGAGNDFILFDNRNKKFPINNIELYNKLCDRRFGIGADGIMLLENIDKFDFKMLYYNADGKESTMCGNGGRCLVRYD
jgi:diaminopimelate epimerase